MNMAKDIDELRELVENIPDTYPDFVNAMCRDSQEVENGVEHLIDFIKSHPDATSSDVIDEMSDMLGCELQ